MPRDRPNGDARSTSDEEKGSPPLRIRNFSFTAWFAPVLDIGAVQCVCLAVALFQVSEGAGGRMTVQKMVVTPTRSSGKRYVSAKRT